MTNLTSALLVMLSAATAAPVAVQQGGDGKASVYVTAQTSVAIIPIVNLSGEKWVELKQRQCDRGDQFLKEEFGIRGFQIVPQDQVTAAIAEIKFDPADEEQYRKQTFYDLGMKVNADLIIFVVITDTSQRLIQQFLAAKREGMAKMKIWLVEPKKEAPILSGFAVEGKSGGSVFAGLDKGSDRQVIAVANGLRDALKNFFKPYPALKKKR